MFLCGVWAFGRGYGLADHMTDHTVGIFCLLGQRELLSWNYNLINIENICIIHLTSNIARPPGEADKYTWTQESQRPCSLELDWGMPSHTCESLRKQRDWFRILTLLLGKWWVCLTGGSESMQTRLGDQWSRAGFESRRNSARGCWLTRASTELPQALPFLKIYSLQN